MQYTQEFQKAVEKFTLAFYNKQRIRSMPDLLSEFLEENRNTKIKEDNEGLNPPRGTSWL